MINSEFVAANHTIILYIEVLWTNIIILTISCDW